MTDNALDRISVAQSTNPSSAAGSIGGGGCYFDDDGRAVVILAAMPDEGESKDHHLHQGETFELGPELWEVTEIVDPETDSWVADLTRIR